jgi:23S rRNA (pseudouridine1915-N3)-methyltransferase
MAIKIVAVGKISTKYLQAGIDDYLKRLQPYCKTVVLELADEKAPDNLSNKQMIDIKNKEGLRILDKIKDSDFVILLDLQGEDLTSQQMAGKIATLQTYGHSDITFVIGGSLGNGENIQKRADFLLSFGQKTFPHQLMRLFLLEQIYRSFKIIKNETYHK